MSTSKMKPASSKVKSALPAASSEVAGFQERLIEGSPDCIKVLDLDGHLLSMNAGGMRALEICDLAPLLGSQWIDFWQGADHEQAAKAVATARAGGIGQFVGLFATIQTRTPKWF